MKHIILVVALLITIPFAACTPMAQPAATQAIEPTQTTISDAGEETEVRDLVENFGKRLQMVSLLAPTAAQALQQQYSEFVSPVTLP